MQVESTESFRTHSWSTCANRLSFRAHSLEIWYVSRTIVLPGTDPSCTLRSSTITIFRRKPCPIHYHIRLDAYRFFETKGRAGTRLMKKSSLSKTLSLKFLRSRLMILCQHNNNRHNKAPVIFLFQKWKVHIQGLLLLISSCEQEFCLALPSGEQYKESSLKSLLKQ